jgi:hypothetical protein
MLPHTVGSAHVRSAAAGHLSALHIRTPLVGLTALDLPCARPAEGEVDPAMLVKPVDLVEDLRHFLHLVDDDLAERHPAQGRGDQEWVLCYGDGAPGQDARPQRWLKLPMLRGTASVLPISGR